MTIANFQTKRLNRSAAISISRPKASGTPTAGVLAIRALRQSTQGYLEASNVDPVKESTDLISAQARL